jgi:dTDP-glucose pyrophosphorylase
MAKWKNTLLGRDATVQEALARINSAAVQIALVVDADLRLLGTLSDGDVRRALLAGTRLSDPIAPFIRTTPTTAHVGDSRESILSKMRRLVLRQIPVLDDAGRVVDLKTIDEYLGPSARENWVVIMAGGLGTRLRELTQDTPKPMLSIGNKPLLETIISRFVEQGFHRIWLSVFYQSGQIEQHFGDGSRFGAEIRYLRESRRLGTAGALSLLPLAPTSPLLVTNADLLTSVDYAAMLDEHMQSDAVATMAVRDYEYQIPYGVVHAEENRIAALDEKPVHQALVNAGIYVLAPEAVARVPRDTSFDMPELFAQLVKEGRTARFHRIHGYWLDIGRHEDLHKALADFPEVFL